MTTVHRLAAKGIRLQIRCFGKVTQIKLSSPCYIKINTEVYNYYVVVFFYSGS